ncbi:hypothetical protein T459_03546 [Capsicum annuum]|uniref:Uncharacterized protein n=1 Tax=Capsicum annuum TaxID=4072 RepID=A0A2G3AN55_CAPAN|nr:hypothetical protein T459_03546 [Capsicum annuum]
MLNGKDSHVGMNLYVLNDLGYVINESIKQIYELIKVKADGESCTSNSQQSTIGSMVTGISISESSRAPPLSHNGTPVLVVPLVDHSMISSGSNFERARAPPLVYNVASMVMIPMESLSLVPLTYPTQTLIAEKNSKIAEMEALPLVKQLKLKLLLKQGRHEETTKDCTKALELNPTYIKSLYSVIVTDMAKILELEPLHDQARRSVVRLKPLADEKRQKMKEEMISELKISYLCMD